VCSEVIGNVDGCPLLRLALGEERAERALLIAGTHGDEPAGVETLVELLAQPPAPWLERLSFDVLPCTNPSGYAQATRENAAGLDLNWSWDRDDVPEVEVLRRFLRGRHYLFILDLHEDWESPGFYMYEHLRGEIEAVGPRVIDRVSELCAINRASAIEGWPAVDGVVRADSDKARLTKGDGFPLVLFRDHTDHKMTTETPSGLPLAQRVRIQRLALDTVVAGYLEPRSR
jgi:hypothetical protein